MGDLLRDYTANGHTLRHRDCEADWRLHLSVLDQVKAADLSTADLTAYRTKRTSEGASQTTVARELQTLRKPYRLGADSDPAKLVRIPMKTW